MRTQTTLSWMTDDEIIRHVETAENDLVTTEIERELLQRFKDALDRDAEEKAGLKSERDDLAQQLDDLHAEYESQTEELETALAQIEEKNMEIESLTEQVLALEDQAIV